MSVHNNTVTRSGFEFPEGNGTDSERARHPKVRDVPHRQR